MATGGVRRGIEQRFGHSPSGLHEIGVGLQIGVAQQGNPALTAADEFTGPPQMKVLAGDFETVGVFKDDP